MHSQAPASMYTLVDAGAPASSAMMLPGATFGRASGHGGGRDGHLSRLRPAVVRLGN
jgi:hypothetical protein